MPKISLAFAFIAAIAAALAAPEVAIALGILAAAGLLLWMQMHPEEAADMVRKMLGPILNGIDNLGEWLSEQISKWFSKNHPPQGPGGTDRPQKVPRPGSGKDRANDPPSWAKGNPPYVGESGKDYARRMMDEHYGPGNWDPKDTGPGSEYNKIKKYGDRAWQDPNPPKKK
ncbi:hypothetical protein ACIP5Y_21700 [Nocardia sp. NPDC088792]|uniref:hypothetical protein n=1 Tax=Nocardia sp. NPDC088792 TaxID=3364332 RepID=UPI00382F6C29